MDWTPKLVVHCSQHPQIVANLLSHMLYEKRFGPWFSEPVVAGLQNDGKPYICAFDMIGF